MELNERDIDLQREAPTLAAIGKEIPFIVPAGYFQELSDNINSRVSIESLRSDNNNGFNLPAGYFEELTSRIEGEVSVERIKSFTSSEGFALPEAYFDSLSGRIKSRLENPSKGAAPVRQLFTSWLSYAAAASISVIIATGIYFSSSTYNLNRQLSEVPDQEIINYLQAHSTPGDTPFIIENLKPDQLEAVTTEVSAEDLELYINSTTL